MRRTSSAPVRCLVVSGASAASAGGAAAGPTASAGFLETSEGSSVPAGRLDKPRNESVLLDTSEMALTKLVHDSEVKPETNCHE